MNFQELQNEVITFRFKEAQRASVKRWLNERYQMVWAAADWPWKRLQANLSLTQGDATPTLPSDFLRPQRMYDDDGFEVLWMDPDSFDESYLSYEIDATQGKPEAFKWVNATLTLAPLPNAAYTYKLIYERKPTHLQSDGTTEVAGLMDEDGDLPIFDATFHYMLVYGASASGLRLENDPTYPQMEEAFMTQLQVMRDHYLPATAAAGHLQYGADQF